MPVKKIERRQPGKPVIVLEPDAAGEYTCFYNGTNIKANAVKFVSLDDVGKFLLSDLRRGVRIAGSKTVKNVYIDGTLRPYI